MTKNSTMASGTRGSSIPHFSTTGRARHLFNISLKLYSSVTSHRQRVAQNPNPNPNRGLSIPHFSTTGRAMSLQHFLKIVLTSHRLSTCQFSNILGAMKTNSTLSITSYAIKHTSRTLATVRQLLRTPMRRIPPRWLPGWKGTTCLTTWRPGVYSSRSS